MVFALCIARTKPGKERVDTRCLGCNVIVHTVHTCACALLPLMVWSGEKCVSSLLCSLLQLKEKKDKLNESAAKKKEAFVAGRTHGVCMYTPLCTPLLFSETLAKSNPVKEKSQPAPFLLCMTCTLLAWIRATLC